MHNPNTRLDAFSDGVFAIAATLLIIEIKVPPHDTIHSVADLSQAFLHQWPSWVAFFMSFISIGIGWVNHNHNTRLVDKSSSKYTYATVFLLLTCVVLPFPTAAVAEYLQTDYCQPAVSFYCVVGLLSNIAWILVGHTAMPLYKSTVNLTKINEQMKFVYYGTALYASVFVLSFWFPLTAISIMWSSYLLWLVLGIASTDFEE